MPFTPKEFDLIRNLTSIDAISGYEKKLRDYLIDEYTKMGYDILKDNLGGVFAYKKSKNPNAFTVMIDAHMDEVGFLIGEFLEDGKITLLPVGGLSPEHILDAPLRVRCKHSCLEGKFKSDETNKAFYLDLGFSSKEEIINSGVNYGDIVTFTTEMEQIEEDLYVAKAYDDRYGIALGLEILEHFKDVELPFNLYVGGTVQEEVGLRGARTNLDIIKPDLAIVLDCSRGDQDKIPLGKVNEGVLIRYYDRAMIAFKELLNFQVLSCNATNAKYQPFYTMGGTNAGAIHTYGNGVLTLTHCVCAKNIHTDAAIFSSNDYQDAKKSLIEILRLLNEPIFNELRSQRR